MSIGEMLKQARSEKNLSQEEVAERAGVSRQTVSNWETGKCYPDIVNVMALSDIYGVTLDSLLKGDLNLMKHLEESTNVTKSNKQIAASIVALGVSLLGIAFTVFLTGGQLRYFLDFPSITVVVIPLLFVLIITRGFKLFATGFRAAIFQKKELEEETREQAASLYRLLTKTAALTALIGTLFSMANLLTGIDFTHENAMNTLGMNLSVVLILPIYSLLLIIFIFEPIAYILKRKR